MSAIRHHLQEGEEIVYRAHPSRIALVPFVLVALLLIGAAFFFWQSTQNPVVLFIGAAVAAVPLLGALQQLIVLRSNEFILTNRRVIKQTGIFTKRSVDTYLDKINNVEHRQSMWGRILGWGDVEIDTASETGLTRFPMVNDPVGFKRSIVTATEQLRNMRFGAAPLAAASLPTTSNATRIRELKQLLDDGLISEEEYEAKRRKLVEEL